MNRFNKFSIVLILIVLSCSAVLAQADKEKKKSPGEKIEQYWFVLLKTGPKKDFDSIAKAKLFEGHMANINKLYYDGILKVAGPFGKNELTWRGIFVFDCKTREEAEKYAAADPAIAAGLFVVDIVPWYSEAIGSFVHGKPEKEK